MNLKSTITYASAFLMFFALLSCGTEDEKIKNEMQQESTEPTMRRDAENRGIEPSSGLVEDNDADLSTTNPNIGGYEMMPSQSIVENLTSNAKLTILASTLRKAEVVDALNATGPYTVFAPNNEAFEGLPENALEDLMKPANKAQLVELLNNHVVAGQLKMAQLQDGSTLKTLGGGQLKVTRQGERIMVNGAEVTEKNAMSKNGVIHIINKVITAGK